MNRVLSRREIIALCFLMLLVLGLRIYSLPLYPYHEDEVGSIFVMRSIVETGLPLTPGGALYWRSLLGHYQMSVPLFFLPVSPYSTRLVCVIFSILLLPVIYSMGKRAESPLAGWLAALFLGFSAFENLYASFARFYLPFQFFFIAAVFLSGEYFVRRRPGSGVWLLMATMGAIGTHQFAVMLFPVFAIGLLLGRRWDLLRERSFLASIAFLAVMVYLLIFYNPSGAFVNHVAIPLQVGGLADKLAFLKWYMQFVPFGITLLALGLFPLWRDGSRIWLHYAVSFITLFVFLSLVAPDDNHRYLSHILPLGVVCASASLAWWINTLITVFLRKDGQKHHWALTPLIATLVLALPAAMMEACRPGQAFGAGLRFLDQEPAHRLIERNMRPGDLLISTEPGFAEIYFGRRADFFLREKFDAKTGLYQPFTEAEKEGSPIPFIDSSRRLRQILVETDRRIWLYANWKIAFTVSPETDLLIRQKFRPVFSGNETYVLIRP